MVEFAVLTGHLTSRSRSGAVARTLLDELRLTGAEATEIAVGELPHSALMAGNRRHPAVQASRRVVAAAEAVAVVTPRYEPHGSVPLRSWLAMLPSDALAGKPVLPVGLGTVRSHSIGLGGGLGAARVLPATFLYDHWFTDTGGWRQDPRADDLVRRTARTLRAAAFGEVVAA
ncbi:NAD(P)H-dependent oxidoreductase [Saccharopolyspora sp. NPDC049426]|uniref:NADPH-dependent FMN reductase n=1 Tax=Saccharopolyspora sp. NPDC049426 TaxID=3155652 RepID=UPI00343F91BA